MDDVDENILGEQQILKVIVNNVTSSWEPEYQGVEVGMISYRAAYIDNTLAASLKAMGLC